MIEIEKSWEKVLAAELEKPYFKALRTFVEGEYKKAADKAVADVYPAQENIFKAFEHTHFDDVRVVILGQDPYHDEGQAHGLSFSVQKGTRVPPSLQNIFKEIASDTGVSPDTKDGDLKRWADQGVLLLNATLTVEAGMPASHRKHGWEEFTNAVIEAVSENKEHVVFILWGNYARGSAATINASKHLIIESAHPSPLSAYRGFFGSKPFSKANEYLSARGFKPIDWR
jgi:uracil-DNA glycosylase